MSDEGREEFLTEAQEIIEEFSRDLLSIDEAHKKGLSQPELLNEAFRAMHTLKGLASLFGSEGLSSLAHRLEDLLDRLRLGKTEISPEVLDVLFGAVDVCHELLASEKEGEERPLVAESVGKVLRSIAALEQDSPEASADVYQISPSILAVLTEYEEHRLKANLDGGCRMYRVRTHFDLMTIDKELEVLKERARQFGEVITYLPTGEISSPELLELDLILASAETLAALVRGLGGESILVEEIPLGESSPDDLTGIFSPEAVVLKSLSESMRAPALPVTTSLSPVSLSLEQNGSKGEVVLSRRAVRVDIHKLDSLMNIMGELSILKGELQRGAETVRVAHSSGVGGELLRLHRILERRLQDLQGGILEMRMVPLGQMFDRLARGVRQISRDVGKEVRFVVTGSETEIDKLLVEELGDPLLHMLRNAIDHGIEDGESRRASNKSPVGTIALNAYQKGSHVVIEVEDDGKGIDEDKLGKAAVSAGAVEETALAALNQEERLALLFFPGLSTSDNVSQVSGRGVGMDVVKTNIGRLGGVIDVQSERGIGTKMTLTLPVTLAIFGALLVKVQSQTFAIPLSSIAEVVKLEGSTRIVESREIYSLRGASLPLCRLGSFFGINGEKSSGQVFVVVTRVGERRLGLVVDELAGQQDIVIKTLGSALASVRGFSGATELGEKRVGLVIDVASVLEEVLAPGDALRHGGQVA